jgi:hypothetical protein
MMRTGRSGGRRSLRMSSMGWWIRFDLRFLGLRGRVDFRCDKGKSDRHNIVSVCKN